MKKVLYLIIVIMFSINICGQNFTVTNPPSYPLGINIDVDYPTVWAREFNFTHNKGPQIFSFGALGKGDQLTYGFIGGGTMNANYNAPWMVFLPSGNIGVGTKSPQAKLDINGDIKAKSIDVAETSPNLLKSVLARLWEGNTVGEGTYLGVKAYNTAANTKSFSLEHMFYGELNSSINFFRGNSRTGGFITISVNNGTDLCKLSDKLFEVNGTIRSNEVKIEATGWSDFVFDECYRLPSLSEVEAHIKENKHLPDIPSEKEVLKDGINVVEMQAKLLQKIEELTLYVIEQDKKIENQNKEIKELKERVKEN
ncbi:hypothetical protein [Dysgonomonas mossii]|uniref:hypothetical protein n=1 Tax=Dysgonomonas mossii TaxID=163665 RepID=UPI001D161CC7|nr:hypothetical protein [Dysgonomonas mossii]